MLVSSRSLCLVANDLDYLMRNGGIGTYNWLMAHALAGRGWRVHVLYCGDPARRKALRSVAATLGAAGIGFTNLDDFELPVGRLPFPRCVNPRLDRSERIRHVLEVLHSKHRFDLIEFAEWEGNGYRSIQARRMGVAFGDVRMIVKLHSSSEWMREGNQHYLGHPDELVLDYCERYAFENADHQLSPSRYMLDYARRAGWRVRDDAQVVSYPFPEPQFVPALAPVGQPPEIVFFGRLETRKGLEVFVEAVRELDSDVRVTFLGRPVTLSGGTPALEFIRSNMRGRKYSLVTRYSRERALGYLAQGNRLAVIASLRDNAPFAVIECLVNGIPFIASRVGGIPELVTDPEARERLLFAPNARDLLRCLKQHLTSDVTHRAALHDKLRDVATPQSVNREVAADYEGILRQDVSNSHSAPEENRSPLVTVAVPYYNSGAFLPETLASLAAQTYSNLEVLVIDDGTTDPESVRVLEKERRRYPQFRFLTQPNSGIGATRNRGLHEAAGAYFIPVDADNIARPDMVERFVAAMERNPQVSALTCYFFGFADSADLAARDYLYAYRPTAGPHVLACFKNIYGDGNAIFRTADFRAVGGYETDRDTSFEDWEAFVKLVNAGCRIDVVPEHLFYYRHLDSGFSRVTNAYRNHQRVLRQFHRIGELPAAEQRALWAALVGFMTKEHNLHVRMRSLRYQIADALNGFVKSIPFVHGFMKAALVGCRRVRQAVAVGLRGAFRKRRSLPRRSVVQMSRAIVEVAKEGEEATALPMNGT